MLHAAAASRWCCASTSATASARLPPEFYEFYNLGLGDPIAVSSVHGHGTGDLLDAVLCSIWTSAEEDGTTTSSITVGRRSARPNAGKSSPGQPHCGPRSAVIVSDIAGTTRDATDTVVENEHGKFVFIDTAGIRRKSKVEEAIERYSVLRAYMAVDRSNRLRHHDRRHRAASPSRIPRWRATPTSRARPASSRSTSGTRWRTRPTRPCRR